MKTRATMTAMGIPWLILAVFLTIPQLRADEFVGPFPSWSNVKTEFGAVGDGKADDTAALQKALDALSVKAKGKRVNVVYLPTGTYRITKMLKVAHITGGVITGEDPVTTIIKWDGPVNGTMLRGNSGFNLCRLARLTWDGSGTAMTAIDHAWIMPPQGGVGTYLTHEDEIFKDVGYGIRAGENSKKGSGMDAEGIVQRCKFVRCWNAGISIETFNALDWWLPNCEFIDCRVGATNAADGEYGGGHFHIYHSVFRRSTEADIKIGHCSYFGIRFNTSIDSAAFLLAIRPNGVISRGMHAGSGSGGWGAKEKWGASVMLQSNVIIDPLQSAAIRYYNHGPLFLLDNTIRTRKQFKAGPVVFAYTPVGKPDVISIGNTFTVPDAIDTNARHFSMDNTVVAYNDIKKPVHTLPPTPKKVNRPVIEVSAGAGAKEIQKAIDQAAKLQGQRPVVHFAAAHYNINETISIPANSDMQLVGDGIYRWGLRWMGADGQTMLKLAGPTKVTMRDMQFYGSEGWNKGGKASPSVLVTNSDQPGSRFYSESLHVKIKQQKGWYGIIVDGCDNLRSEMYAFGNSGTRIIGGARAGAGKNVAGRFCIFGGASGDNWNCYDVKNGARMMVWDTWYEGSPPQFLKLEGKGFLTMSGAVFSCGPGGNGNDEALPELEVADFDGRLTCVSVNASGKSRVQVQEFATDKLKALFMGCHGGLVDKHFVNESKEAQVSFLNNRGYTKNKAGSLEPLAVPNEGDDTSGFVLTMLHDLRTIVPEWDIKPTGKGISDLRLYRVRIEYGGKDGGIVLRGGGK